MIIDTLQDMKGIKKRHEGTVKREQVSRLFNSTSLAAKFRMFDTKEPSMDGDILKESIIHNGIKQGGVDLKNTFVFSVILSSTEQKI